MCESQIFFSIIIPTYNGGERIADTLKSISNQNFPIENYEVIVVDDASPDEIAPYILKFNNSLSHPINIRTVRCKSNRRRGGALNLGFYEAKGKYLLNIDDDDVFLPDALNSLHFQLKDQSLDILMYDSNKIVNDIIDNSFQFPNNNDSIFDGEYFIKEQQVSWTTWHYAINRNYFLKNQFKFAENVLFEDVDFSLAIVAKASKIKYFQKQILSHIYRSGQVTKIGNDLNRIQDLFNCALRTKLLAETFKHNQIIQNEISNHAIFQYKIMLKRYVWRLSKNNIVCIIKENKPSFKLNSIIYDNMYRYPLIYCGFSFILKKCEPIIKKLRK